MDLSLSLIRVFFRITEERDLLKCKWRIKPPMLQTLCAGKTRHSCEFKICLFSLIYIVLVVIVAIWIFHSLIEFFFINEGDLLKCKWRSKSHTSKRGVRRAIQDIRVRLEFLFFFDMHTFGCRYILFVGSSLLVPRTAVLILCTVHIRIGPKTNRIMDMCKTCVRCV
jgi:hypothetical protein